MSEAFAFPSPATGIPSLKLAIANLLSECERCRRVAYFHRDPLQADNAARVARQYLNEARNLTSVLLLVRGDHV